MGRVERFRDCKSKATVARRAPWARNITKVGSIYVAYEDPSEAAEEHAPIGSVAGKGLQAFHKDHTDISNVKPKKSVKAIPPVRLPKKHGKYSSARISYIADRISKTDTLENRYLPL